MKLLRCLLVNFGCALVLASAASANIRKLDDCGYKVGSPYSPCVFDSSVSRHGGP